MNTYIHHLSTLTPAYACPQDLVRERMKSWATDEKGRRMIDAVYKRSGIETRYSVLPDFQTIDGGGLFAASNIEGHDSPGTAQRNAIYAAESRSLAVQLARQTLAESKIDPQSITHLVFASCTGFANPGPDFHIIRELGLNPRVERYTLGFMGCYAAIPALRLAAQISTAQPEAVVLVMCLEICTVHMQLDSQPDNLLANSLFADGAAAAIVCAQPPAPGQPAYQLSGFRSTLVPDSEAHMAWEIGNHGFNIVLSSYVPDLLAANLRPAVQQLLHENGQTLADIEEWAVHPGGRAILDKVAEALDLENEALDVSRSILRHYGNMSSATVLFVLKESLARATTPDATVCALAFGPGLTVESAVFERLGGPLEAHRTEDLLCAGSLAIA